MSIKAAATITAKGQLTLPVEIRKALDVKQGDQLVFEVKKDRKLTVSPRRRRSIFELRDMLPPLDLGRPLAQADIDNAIGEAMTAQEQRIRKDRRK